MKSTYKFYIFSSIKSISQWSHLLLEWYIQIKKSKREISMARSCMGPSGQWSFHSMILGIGSIVSHILHSSNPFSIFNSFSAWSIVGALHLAAFSLAFTFLCYLQRFLSWILILSVESPLFLIHFLSFALLVFSYMRFIFVDLVTLSTDMGSTFWG